MSLTFTKQPKQPRHTIPTVTEYDPEAVEEIIGTVRQVRNWSVLLWNCPEQKWYSLANQAQADLMQRCQETQTKVRVTVRGMEVLEIVI
jgi:hypothetical protein